jgi:hypothetical protein
LSSTGFSKKIEKLDLVTGAPLPTFTPIAEATVNALLVDGGSLYVAASGITLFDAHSGAGAGAFGAGIGGGSVLTMTALPDGIAVGGDFTRIGTTIVSRIAKLSRNDGSLVSGFATTGIGGHFAGGLTHAAAIVATPNGLFVAGDLTSAGGVTAPHVAKFVGATLAADAAFAPPVPDASVTALALSGNDLYVGGGFNHIGAGCAAGLTKLDATSGSRESFPAYLGPATCNTSLTVTSLVADASGVAVAGTYNALQVNGANVAAASGASRIPPDGSSATAYTAANPVTALALAIPIPPGLLVNNCIFLGTTGGMSVQQWNPSGNTCSAGSRSDTGPVGGIRELGSGLVLYLSGSSVLETNQSMSIAPSAVASGNGALNAIGLSSSGMIVGGGMTAFSDIGGGTALVEGLAECDTSGARPTRPARAKRHRHGLYGHLALR